MDIERESFLIGLFYTGAAIFLIWRITTFELPPQDDPVHIGLFCLVVGVFALCFVLLGRGYYMLYKQHKIRRFVEGMDKLAKTLPPEKAFAVNLFTLKFLLSLDKGKDKKNS